MSASRTPSPPAGLWWFRSAVIAIVVFGTFVMHTGVPVANAAVQSAMALERVTPSGTGPGAMPDLLRSPAVPHAPAHGGSGALRL